MDAAGDAHDQAPTADPIGLAGLHVALLTAWASHLGGGVATAAWQQARMIRAAGGAVTIIALADEGSSEGDLTEPGITVLTVPVKGPRQIGYAPALARCLDRVSPDILHLHGSGCIPPTPGPAGPGGADALTWYRRTACSIHGSRRADG